MTARTSFCLLAACLLLAGCNNAPRGVVRPEDMKPDSEAPAQPEPNGETQAVEGVEGDTPTPQPEARKPITNPTSPANPPTPPNAPKIVSPGTDGWNPIQESPTQFAAKIDRTIAGLTNVAGTYEADIRNEEKVGSTKGNFLIASNSRYRIDFLDVKDPSLLMRFYADGERKKTLLADGWTQEVSVRDKVPSPSGEISDRFLREFARMVFEPLADRAPVWEPLLRDLGADNYSVTLETKQIATQGVLRPFFRLVATHPTESLRRLEVRFDGVRNIPLTIRLIGNGKGNKPITAEWRSRWSFNQKVESALAKP